VELRKKILAGYGLVLALAVAVSVWAVINLSRLGSASEAILQENYRSILAAENMINAIERQDSSLLLIMQGHKAEGLTQFRQNELAFLEWLGRAKDNITLAGEAEVLKTIEDAYLTFIDVSAPLPEMGSGQPPRVSSYYLDTVLPEFIQIREACIYLREMNQQAMVAASERAQEVSVRAIWSAAIFGISVGAIGLIFSLLLSNVLVYPLKEMTRAAERIAEGDYDVAITVKSNDELGRLGQEIMAMSRKLKHYHEINVNQVLAEKRRGEAIIRSINDGLIVVDADFRIIAINPMAAQILDITLAEARGQHCFDVLKSPKLYAHMKSVAETGRPPQLDPRESTFAVEHGDKTEYYQFSITPVRTEQDQMLGVVLLLQDVTKLAELDRLKSEFVMTASHELRTPLTSIAMSIGLLMEGAASKLTNDEQELLQAAQEDAQRLRNLVKNLLDLSKIEAGRMDMEFESVEVSLLADRAMSTMVAQISEKGIELSQQIPAKLPAVKVDPNKITWVLTNLIANALRYTDQGGHITVWAEKMNGFVGVSVADDGVGIPLEHQSKIFDKFVQVKSNQTVGGSGLGLAICKEIIKAHGGAIWVESAPGEGSTFTFTIPIANHPSTSP
jgi:NtrC-family two-component system sensor histidine kinase KinB